MYIVSYDIASNKLRRKIAKELENYGIRVQYSVFECDLTQKLHKEMYAKLVRLMDGCEDGSIRIYELCENCKAKTRVIGVEKKDEKHARDDTIVL